MDKFSLLPFSIGCVSHSSIDVIENRPNKTQRESRASSSPSGRGQTETRLKSSISHPGHIIPRSNLGEKLHKLGKSLKSLPHVFQVNNKEDDDDDDDDDDDEVVEMQIGLPIDVQHVGHIGWDASDCGVSTIKSWDREAPQFLSFPSSLSV